MINRTLLLLSVIFVVAASLFVVFLVVEKISLKRAASQRMESVSNFSLFDLDSSRLLFTPGRKTLLVYFGSGCEYCESEIDDIHRNIMMFREMDIILVSSENISAIASFRNMHSELVRAAGFRFGKINADQAYETFGSLIVPQIFIYGNDGNLIKKFTGETSAKMLQQYL